MLYNSRFLYADQFLSLLKIIILSKGTVLFDKSYNELFQLNSIMTGVLIVTKLFNDWNANSNWSAICILLQKYILITN